MSSNLLYSTQAIDHLGLISGMIDEIGLVDYVDELLPKTAHNSKLSNGELLKAMILNGLGYTSQPLYLYHEYFTDKALNKIFDKEISPSEINDKALGRALDCFHDYSLERLYTGLAKKITECLGIEVNTMHMDTTSFHVDGSQYSNDDTSVKVTHGYSKDHRPDLQQVILNLIVDNKSSIPLMFQSIDGNQSDKKTFQNLINSHVKSLKSAYNNKYLIADSSLFTPESIERLDLNKMFFITRVPSTLSVTKHEDLLDKNNFLKINENYSFKTIGFKYNNVNLSLHVYYSIEYKNSREKTAKKHLQKITQEDAKIFNKLKRIDFDCKDDAKRELEKFKKSLRYSEINNAEIVEFNKKNKLLYKISGEILSSILKKNNYISQLGYFTLATNDHALKGDEVLNKYKEQQRVERGFRFMKGQEFLASAIYLKTPKRIESLLMLMTLSLAIYSAIEYKIRTILVLKEVYFPDQKGKDNQNPTARWVFYCFKGIHILTIDDYKDQLLILNLQDRHRIILDILGQKYWRYYK